MNKNNIFIHIYIFFFGVGEGGLFLAQNCTIRKSGTNLVQNFFGPFLKFVCIILSDCDHSETVCVCCRLHEKNDK